MKSELCGFRMIDGVEVITGNVEVSDIVGIDIHGEIVVAIVVVVIIVTGAFVFGVILFLLL